jgi:Phage portal protein
MANWLDELRKSIVDSLKSDIKEATLSGLEEPLEKAANEEAVGRKALLLDPFYESASNSYFLMRGKLSRISNRTLKDVSVRDWLVSTIIQNRVDTLLRFARPSHDRFKMGYKFTRRDGKQPTEEDLNNIKFLEEFVYNCGRTDNVTTGDVMNFGEFMKLVVRDALTFGYVGVEKILTRSQSLHRFRPIPAETLYRVNPQNSKEVVERTADSASAIYRKAKSNNDPRDEGTIAPRDIEYYKYVQVTSDGQPIAVFGDEDLIFKLANPQNFADSNGYCLSVVEQAIIMITNHLNVENFNGNYFTHGYAARGILHLKGTVTQNALAAFRRQFYNSISGTQNAWRTPIVAGLDDVQWVPMSGSAREMEYINYNSHIMRALCAQFQIDPIEVGLDFLTSANGRAASNAKESGQFKITYSRERGLLPLLMLVEDMVNNDIIKAYDKVLADTYCFKFQGYDDNTAQTDVALRQAQMTTFASMNYLLSVEGKEKIDHPIADLPLNQSFWALAEKNMTRGEIREFFFKDSGASQRPELQYIPADPMFAQWSQMLLTISSQKKQMEDQAAAQQQQQADAEHQKQLQLQQEQREQEKHEAEQSTLEDQKAQQAVNYTQQLHESAKTFGASSASHVGGKTMKNPMNLFETEE